MPLSVPLGGPLARRYSDDTGAWKWGCFPEEAASAGKHCVTETGEKTDCKAGKGDKCANDKMNGMLENIINKKEQHCQGKIFSIVS